MNPIADKVGISAEQFKKLVASGVVSTSWVMKEEVFIFYKEKVSKLGHTEAVDQAADKFKVDRSQINRILREDIFK